MDKGNSIQIGGKVVAPGSHQVIRLEIEQLPSSTLIDMPVLVFNGTEPGPVLLLVACMHGDEINGTEALRRLARRDKLMPQKGTIISVPIVNLYGFLHQSRTLPDGKDLNRCFPGSARGSLASRLAHVVMTELLPHCDCVIDLHTGGAARSNHPQIRCDFNRPKSLALGQAFAAPLLIHSSEIDGSFRKAASSMDKPIVVFEGGESLRFHEPSIRSSMEGIQLVMAHLGMCHPEREGRDSVLVNKRKWVRAASSGVFCPFVELGNEVIEGQVIAHLGDPYGVQIEDILAPFDGYVIGLNNQAIVHAGDAVAHIGKKE